MNVKTMLVGVLLAGSMQNALGMDNSAKKSLKEKLQEQQEMLRKIEKKMMPDTEHSHERVRCESSAGKIFLSSRIKNEVNAIETTSNSVEKE